MILAGMLSKRPRRLTTRRKIGGQKERVFQIVSDSVAVGNPECSFSCSNVPLPSVPTTLSQGRESQVGEQEIGSGVRCRSTKPQGGNPDLPGSRIETV